MRYTKEWEVLINPTWEQEVSREPLLAFLFVLSTRNNQLAKIADEIIDCLNEGVSNERIYGPSVTRGGTLIWLWTLGAYEVVRTMCQAKSCFSQNCLDKLQPLKNKLAKVRMPDAKMEKKGKKVPVNSNRSPWLEVVESKDLLIGDPEEPYSARALIDEYFSIIDSISPEDVIDKHEKSYG